MNWNFQRIPFSCLAEKHVPSIHLMRRFKHRLGTIGARIYGVVLNGIKSGSMEYDYYGSGYYEYYAKSDADTSTPMLEDVEIHRTEK